jgi:hypothetical protein
MRPVYGDSHLSAENIEQHSDATGIVQTVEYPELFGERTCGEPDWGADFQIGVELEHALCISHLQHGFNDSMWSGAGKVASHDQTGYSKRTVHAAPAVAIQIQRDEKVAGKERSNDRAEFPRMPDGSLALGQKRIKALVLELCFRALFRKR